VVFLRQGELDRAHDALAGHVRARSPEWILIAQRKNAGEAADDRERVANLHVDLLHGPVASSKVDVVQRVSSLGRFSFQLQEVGDAWIAGIVLEMQKTFELNESYERLLSVVTPKKNMGRVCGGRSRHGNIEGARTSGRCRPHNASVVAIQCRTRKREVPEALAARGGLFALVLATGLAQTTTTAVYVA